MGAAVARHDRRPAGDFTNYYQNPQIWFVKDNGRGLDGVPLMTPVEGNLTGVEETLILPDQLKLMRHLADLNQRVRRLESVLIEQGLMLGSWGD